MDSLPHHAEIEECEMDTNAAKTKIKYSCFANAEAAVRARGELDHGVRKTKIENDNKPQTEDEANDGEPAEETEQIKDIANPTRAQIILYANHGEYPYRNEKRISRARKEER